jgi:CheY-like chemotaxis protein
VDAPSNPRSRSRHRVLVVEDNPDGRVSLQLLLQAWGYDVDVAENGSKGLEKALSWQPESAVVDIGLPGLDGYQVARRIRAALDERIRLIALTAYGQPEDRERAMSEGFDAFLTKPADLDELARLLETGKRVGGTSESENA